MKRLIIALFVLMGIVMAMPLTASAASEVTVVLPEYKCIINESDVYFKDQQYPLLNYKDITYFPMTWNHCRYMDLTSDWVQGSGLYIAAKPNSNVKNLGSYPLKKGTVNKSRMKATVVNYPVYINGEPAPKDSTYPILNFRGITYFPMTWTYSHDCLGWRLDFRNRTFTVETYPLNCSRIEGEQVGNTLVYYKTGDSKDLVYTMDFSNGKTSVSEVTREEKYKLGVLPTVSVSDKLSLKGNVITIDGVDLHVMKALETGETTVDDVELSGQEITQNGVTYLRLCAYYGLNIPAPYTPVEEYVFVKTEKGYIYVDSDVLVYNMGKNGAVTYVCAKEKTGHRYMTFANYITYEIKPDGSVKRLNDDSRFKDFGSVEFAGAANGKVCLKCLWAPENYPDGDENQTTIAPYNDGFYSYDGTSLKQIHKYTFTMNTVVGPNGDIYGYNGYMDTMKKLGVLK